MCCKKDTQVYYFCQLGFDIVSDTCRPAPCYLNSNKLFLILRDRYRNPERDSNLGPKRLSLLEFSTWGLRPLDHHGRLYSRLLVLQFVKKHFSGMN